MPSSTCRSTYLAMAGAQLIEIQKKVYIVNGILRDAINNGTAIDGEQLRHSRNRIEFLMIAAQQKLENLKNTDDANWETAKDAFNIAWEDVTQSIRLVVARFR